MEAKYSALRMQLNELGYTQCFPLECLPLVESLTADLIQTTRSLHQYVDLSKETLKQRDQLQAVIEPYKCDNAKLVKENTELHRALLTSKEECATSLKTAKNKIRSLENELALLKHQYSKAKTECRECQLKNICAETVSSRNRSVTSNVGSDKSSSRFKEPAAQLCNCNSSSNLRDILQETAGNLKEQQNKAVSLSEDILFLKRQLEDRDEEIDRLTRLLEGGRPYSAIKNDCCYKDFNGRLSQLMRQLEECESRNESLQKQLKEALNKQHEAMSRAVHLADRNSALENELLKIDQLAFKIESECNSKLKEKCNVISSIKGESNFTEKKIKMLEMELEKIIMTHQKCAANLESNQNEIHALQVALDSVNSVKDKLVRENNTLLEANRQLEVMACRNYAEKGKETESKETSRSKSRLFRDKQTWTNKDHVDAMSREELLLLLENERRFYESKIKEIQKQISDKSQVELPVRDSSSEIAFMKLRDERDFYFHEYKNLKTSVPPPKFVAELQDKICELEQHIQTIKKQNDMLVENTCSLTSQLEITKQKQKCSCSNVYQPDNYIHSTINRLEDDLKRSQTVIRNLEDEKNTLRDRLLAATDSQRNSHRIATERESRFESMLKESREINTVRSMTTMQMDSMRQECENLREKLKIAETELLHTKTLNSQLKTLQLETDRNIEGSRNQMQESKKEIRFLKESVSALEKIKLDLEQQVEMLKADKVNMKENLSRLDQERDKLVMGIDDKTETISSLQHKLRSRETNIEMLENKGTELNRKLELMRGENSSLEQKLRDAMTAKEAMSMEVDAISTQKDCVTIENRRLQSDMAAIANDLKTVNREYEGSRKEVEEMKQQLQHYVDEVRRIEEILSRKEAERTEMLDHFASLSHEASVLETNNHSLETDAANKSAQLLIHKEKLVDTERKLQDRESLIEMQEEKISSLIYKISKLENDLEQQKDIFRVTEKNLEYAREMCLNLESQKKSMVMNVGESDAEIKKLKHNLKVMNDEKDRLEEVSTKYKTTVDSLETLLSNSRREVIELKLQLQDSLDEVKQLKSKVESLQKKLNVVEEEGNSSRLRAEEATKHLQDLQWQMTDERFQRVRTAQSGSTTTKTYQSGTL